ncbi:MAG: hypothetical protein NVS4B12_04070 [Ktedonobacteraceae bacterium]
MSRTLEAIFRQPVQLLILLILPLVISLGIAYILPRSYQSSASLWALKRYEVIGATGPEANLLATPAETQVAALSELLKSRTFALAVAKSGNVASSLSLSQAQLADVQLSDDALLLEVSQHVQVVARGYNLYEISYINHDPHVAYKVVAAVIQEFQLQGKGFSIVEGQRLLQGDQTQLLRVQSDVDDAVKAESQYLASHPDLTKVGATPLNDPQYALLDAKRVQEQAVLQTLESNIATLSQEITTQSTGDDTFFKTLDTPVQPDVAVSRFKSLLTAGGIGAGIGLAACILYILVLVRRDRTIYSTHDLQRVITYPILMQVPQLLVVTMKRIELK